MNLDKIRVKLANIRTLSKDQKTIIDLCDIFDIFINELESEQTHTDCSLYKLWSRQHCTETPLIKINENIPTSSLPPRYRSGNAGDIR